MVAPGPQTTLTITNPASEQIYRCGGHAITSRDTLFASAGNVDSCLSSDMMAMVYALISNSSHFPLNVSDFYHTVF